MYGGAGAGGAAGGAGGGPGGHSYYHHSYNSYNQHHHHAYGGGAFGGGGGGGGHGAPPPLQWPAVQQQSHHHNGAKRGGVRTTAREQLRRWWDAALSGGGRRRRQHNAPPPTATTHGGDPATAASPSSSSGDWLSRACFFAIAVAYKTPWTAVSSLLGQLAALHGPRVLLGLNLAYFLPSIPVLLSHAAAAGGGAGGGGGGASGSDGGGGGSSSPSFEARAGVPTAAALRLFLGLGGLAVVSLLIPPLCASSAPLLLAATAALGALYGVAFGASYSLAARRCAPPGATVALSTGFVACGGVVLAADVAIKRGSPDYSPQGLAALFRAVAATCLVGVLASAVLLRRHWDELEADGGGVSRANAAGGGEGGQGSGGGGGKGGTGGLGASLRQLLFSSSPAAAASAARAAVRILLLLPPRGGVGGARGGKPHVIGVPGGAGGAGGAAAFGGGAGAGSPTHGVRHRALGAESMSLMTSADAKQRRGSSGGGGGDGGGGGFSSSSTPLPLVASSAAAAGVGGGGKGGRWGQRDAAGHRSSEEWSAALATARRIAPAALALSLSVGTSMLAFPFFTYTPAQPGSLGRALPQALFYARLAGDVGGRVLTPHLGISGTRSLVLWSLAKTALLLPLLLALLDPRLAGGDCGLCCAVGLYWALSGAVNTAAYVVAPRLVPAPRRAQAGGLMAACFQAACFAGLAAAAVLQWAVPEPGVVAAAQAAEAQAAGAAGGLAGAGADAGAKLVEAAAAAVGSRPS